MSGGGKGRAGWRWEEEGGFGGRGLQGPQPAPHGRMVWACPPQHPAPSVHWSTVPLTRPTPRTSQTHPPYHAGPSHASLHCCRTTAAPPPGGEGTGASQEAAAESPPKRDGTRGGGQWAWRAGMVNVPGQHPPLAAFRPVPKARNHRLGASRLALRTQRAIPFGLVHWRRVGWLAWVQSVLCAGSVVGARTAWAGQLARARHDASWGHPLLSLGDAQQGPQRAQWLPAPWAEKVIAVVRRVRLTPSVSSRLAPCWMRRATSAPSPFSATFHSGLDIAAR